MNIQFNRNTIYAIYKYNTEISPFWLTTKSAMIGRTLSRITWWDSATIWGCWDMPSRTDMVVVTKSEGEMDPMVKDK